MGIARLPDWVAAPAVDEGQLRRLLKPYLPAAAAWHAVFPSARYLSPKLRVLIELMEAHYGSAKR